MGFWGHVERRAPGAVEVTVEEVTEGMRGGGGLFSRGDFSMMRSMEKARAEGRGGLAAGEEEGAGAVAEEGRPPPSSAAGDTSVMAASSTTGKIRG